MPNAYTWQFEQLVVIPVYQNVTNAVSVVHWQLTASDGLGHTAQATGAQPCGPIDVQDFIPFGDLTPAVVQGWVEQEMGTTQINDYKAWLDQQVAAQVNPPLVSLPPPWQ